MITPLDPVFGALLAHANLNLLSLGLLPLDIESLGAEAPVAGVVMEDDARDPSADCRRCGGRGHIVTVNGPISCPECNREDAP